MGNRRIRSSCGPLCADPEHQNFMQQDTTYKVENTSVAIVTSQKLFSSLRCLKEATMLVWKSFQRRQNCWSSAMVNQQIALQWTNIHTWAWNCKDNMHVLFVIIPNTDYENFTPLQNLDKLEGRKVN